MVIGQGDAEGVFATEPLGLDAWVEPIRSVQSTTTTTAPTTYI